MKYSVKVYLTCYQTIEVEAGDQNGAVEAARAKFWEQPESIKTRNLEFADDLQGFLVDEDGDEEHENTQFYDQYGKPDTL
jgi:hypothetical protein